MSSKRRIGMYVTSVSREASVYIKRRACATSVAVLVLSSVSPVLRRCVRVSTAGSSQSLRAIGCREVDCKQEGTTETTRNGAGSPRAACLRRVSPRVDRQVGVGISLKRARTVGWRRLRIDELAVLGQAIGCLCEDGYTVLLLEEAMYAWWIDRQANVGRYATHAARSVVWQQQQWWQ